MTRELLTYDERHECRRMTLLSFELAMFVHAWYMCM